MYTCTFTFMPAESKWLYYPLKSYLHNCPARHQFENILVCWRPSVSEKQITNSQIANSLTDNPYNTLRTCLYDEHLDQRTCTETQNK